MLINNFLRFVMPKLKKKPTQKNIESNIEKMFLESIDDFLPRNYTKEVLAILPNVNVDQIRMVKMRRAGNIKIINALKKVAEENRELTS